MKVIDLFNGMHNGTIKDGTKFYLNFRNGLRRECYINKKGAFGFIYQVSDNEPCQDYIDLEDDVEIIKEDNEMKVSYYELLGLIKENKNPKKVVYDDVVYNWNDKNYISKGDYCISEQIHEIDMFDKQIYLLPNE